MIPVKNISIPNACHESWQQMNPVAQGRHCQQCSKTITDFTMISSAEIIDYLAITTHVCGSFDLGQLNNLNNTLHVQNLRPNRWRRWIMLIGLLSHTVFNKAVAQTKPALVYTQQTNPNADKMILGKVTLPDSNRWVVIRGSITDEHNRCLSGVIVKVKGTNKSVQTTVDGEFVLYGARVADTLNISYIGFNSQEITITASALDAFNIVLRKSANMLTGEVVVIHHQSFIKRIWHKIKRVF